MGFNPFNRKDVIKSIYKGDPFWNVVGWIIVLAVILRIAQELGWIK